MPNWGYSFKGLDPDRTAIASGRDLRISPKAAREVCSAIKGMKLEEAKGLLEMVYQGRRPIAFRRHKRKVGHRSELQGWPTGRYPKKASRTILTVLESVEANAEFKGLATDRLKVVRASAQKGRKVRKYIPRAFGRSSPYFHQLTHVEIAVEET